MAVAYKSIGTYSTTTTTTFSLNQPALAQGDYAVVTVLSVGGSFTLPGYAQVGASYNLGASYFITFWRYASSAQSATTITASVPSGGVVGRVMVVTGAQNAAPTMIGDVSNSSQAYWQTPAINTTGFMISAAMSWASRALSGTTSSTGSITHATTLHAHDEVDTFRYSLASHVVTAAAGGAIRVNYSSGSTNNDVRTFLIPALETEGSGPAAVYRYDNGIATQMTDTNFRVWRNGVEYGFWYPLGSQNFGQSAATLSYWDGATEHAVPLRSTPTSTVLDGLSLVAYGDSFGAQLSGGGVNYTSGQIFHQQLATLLGTTCTNRHVSGSMTMDVAYKMNNAGDAQRWQFGSHQAVIIHVGGNDLKLHSTQSGLNGFRNAWSAIFGMLRSQSRSLASAGSTSGSWSSTTTGTSGGARSSTTPGSTITLSWTGPDATLLLLAPRNKTGSQFTYSVDGGPSQSLSTINQADDNDTVSGLYGLFPVHIKSVGTGSHAVTVTHTGSNGHPLIVDSILTWHTNLDSIPWVVTMPQPAHGAMAVMPPIFDVPPTPEDVLEFHAELRAAMNESANLDKTITVLPDSYGRWFWSSNENRFINDGYHPNLRGHEIIRDVAYWGIAKGADSGVSGPVPDLTPPTAPAGLAAGVISSTTVALSWSPASDNVGVVSYRVYRNGSSIATIGGTSYTASGLTADTQYTFYVTALDAAGNESSASNTINPTTAAAGATSGVFGPDGSHWPTSTPAMNASFAYDVEVAATASAISAAVAAAPSSGAAIVRVQPGQLDIGYGAQSADSFWLDTGPASRSSKILVVPRDGFGTVYGHSSSTIASKDSNGYKIRLRNVAMLGFDFENQGVNLCDANIAALGWSTFGWLQVVARSNDSNDIEMVECVLPNQEDMEEDRAAVRVASNYGVYGLTFAGCYFAPAYKANGSSAHCDTLQFSVSSGSGYVDNVVFKDTILFQSSSQIVMSEGLNAVSLDHAAFIGGLRATGRYPIAGGRHVMVAQNALWGGAGSATSSNNTVVMGSMSSGYPWSGVTNSFCSTQATMPPGWTANPAWDSQSTLQTAWLNENSPEPTPSYLDNVWSQLAS